MLRSCRDYCLLNTQLNIHLTAPFCIFSFTIDQLKDKNSHATEKRQAQQRTLNSPEYSAEKNLLRKNMIFARDERRKRLEKQTARVERELTNESYKRMISRFDEVFNQNLGEFMMQLKNGDQLHSNGDNLFFRLDYNGYVTRSMGL